VNKIFQGSAELTLARLVEERPISPKELERMKKILDELAESGKGPDAPSREGLKDKKRRKK
jgi:hypothetical protein